jgi:hypothetical protein
VAQIYNVAPAVQQTLDGWHRFVDSAGDVTLLHPLLAEDIVFRSPYVQTPMPGRALATLVLTTVVNVFEDFRYHRSFASGSHDVCLEFSGHVGKWQLKGVDLIHFDEAGRMVEFEVLIRPLKALEAVGEAMTARIGPELARLKAAAAAQG